MIVVVMGMIFFVLIFVFLVFELVGWGIVFEFVGVVMEGKEVCFGILGLILFGSVSIFILMGVVNLMYDLYMVFGGMMLMLNMMFGEVVFGGVGLGLYGMFVFVIIVVFVGGLFVGCMLEYFGKRIGLCEIKFVSLYILVMLILVLFGIVMSFVIFGIREDVEFISILNFGVYGMSEVFYVFILVLNNNGFVFVGFIVNILWFNIVFGIVMLFGWFLLIVFVLVFVGLFVV